MKAIDASRTRVLINQKSTVGRAVLTVSSLFPAIICAFLAVPLITYAFGQSRQAEYYRGVVENLAKPIIVLDGTGAVVLSNKAADILLGCETHGGMAGHNLTDFIEDSDLAKARHAWTSHRDKTSPDDKDVTLRLKRHNGSNVDVTVGIRHLADMHGKDVYVGIVMPTSDIPVDIVENAASPSSTFDNGDILSPQQQAMQRSRISSQFLYDRSRSSKN